MNITDAAYSTVHDYPGGSEALAPRLGMSAAVLRNKVNPNNDTHHLTLAEASKLIGITGDARLAHALASTHGLICLSGAEGEVSDMAVLEMVTSLWSKNGDLGQIVHRALSDGVLSRKEMKEIRSAVYAGQKALADLLIRLKGMAEAE